MRNKFFVFTAFLLLAIVSTLKADEGMWIPLLIEKYNIKLMQEKGFRLTAEDIYSVNKACMKDAVMRLSSGCTGEIISGEGLLITNHHCGRSQIQRHSSLEHDYLANGFWAMSKKEELPNPGFTATFLKRMEDVTDQVLEGVTDNMTSDERDKQISSNQNAIRSKAVEGTNYSATIRPFFMGNQYFLFVDETFMDVRLVGAPPYAVGNFGGDTDNWVWPRHTGDFSLFRIYADKNNKPASYSPDNIPYKPGYYFPISLKGIKEGDFTMVFGYPGSTSEYVPSYYIDMFKNYVNPKLIDIRTRKIDIMDAAMATDPLIRLQYFTKKSGISNSWKRWMGEIQGLEKMNTISKKQEYEKRITDWINADNDRKTKFGNLLPRYREIYNDYKVYYLINSYTGEVFNGAEAIGLARNMMNLVDLTRKDAGEDAIRSFKERLIVYSDDFFKNYNNPTDKKLFVAVMSLYGANIEPEWQCEGYIEVKEKCKGDFASLANELYSKSPFTDQARFRSFVEGFSKSSIKKLQKDAFYILGVSAGEFIDTNLSGPLRKLREEIQELDPLYMRAQMEFEKDRLFYPDANSTLRVAYGEVKGYFSRDAVYFTHNTTLNGIMEKDNPEIYDYDVPDKLRELYRSGDFGRYTQNGEVPVCFIATNHTTGGNSGSPVINADGQLIGVNFDRAWEGVASDMAFNPEQSRNISLDIRYALFLIDKFAGAGYLLDEMTIVE